MARSNAGVASLSGMPSSPTLSGRGAAGAGVRSSIDSFAAELVEWAHGKRTEKQVEAAWDDVAGRVRGWGGHGGPAPKPAKAKPPVKPANAPKPAKAKPVPAPAPKKKSGK